MNLKLQGNFTHLDQFHDCFHYFEKYIGIFKEWSRPSLIFTTPKDFL